MKKRILTALLAVCLVLALGTVTALADGSAEQTETSVALVNGLYYDTLADAVNAIESEDTIELVADVTINKGVDCLVIPAEKTVTLNLNTYTVKINDVAGTSGAIYNKGTLTINAGEGGKIDSSSLIMANQAVYNTGNMTINSGEIVGKIRAVTTANGGTTIINGGELSGNKYGVYVDDNSHVTITGNAQVSGTTTGVYADVNSEVVISGNAKVSSESYAVKASGGDVTIQDNASITGKFGVILANYPDNNTPDAVHSTLTMTGGIITSNGGFALSGNNLQSAGCSAEITGGTLKSEIETGIYWPMDGELTIGGNAVVEGATAIQARMGEINISGNAVILGTGNYSDSAPESGIAAAEGSALLITSQMYGESEGQYATSPNITVNITGGTLESVNGNAVTVYNTEDTEAQETNITVAGGNLEAAEGKAAVQVTTAKSESSSKLDNYNGTNVLTTSASKTTVTVSADVAVAAVDNEGKTYYYSDAEDVQSEITEGAVYIIDEDITLPNMPALNAKVTAERTNALVGSTVTLTATTNPEIDAAFTYQWYMNGELISGATGKTLEVTENGVYEVFITATIKVGDIAYYPIDSASIAYTFSEPTIPDMYDIELIVGEGGEARTSLSNASAGSTITVTVTPDEGYELDYITVDGERISGTSFKMPDYDVTVRVYFTNGSASLPFADVKPGDWFYDAVAYVYANGLMDGTSTTTFEPNANMTRAMVWAILARVDGETVTGEAWSTDARAWAMAEGVSDGTDPNGLVTREQFATMLYRYAVAKGYDVSIGESTNILSYADFASISEYAIPAMQWACGSGIVTGVTDSTLVPQGTATRAQCAAMLMRFAEL